MTADNPHFPVCTKAELLFSPGRDVSIPKAVPLTEEERSLRWALMDSGVFISALKEIQSVSGKIRVRRRWGWQVRETRRIKIKPSDKTGWSGQKADRSAAEHAGDSKIS